MLHAVAQTAHQCALTDGTRGLVVRTALAKVLGLPFVTASSSPPLSHGVCGLCLTAFPATPAAPAAGDDAVFRHISACRRIGVENSNLARHNALARAAAALARECGVQAQTHDGPIFQFGTVRGETKQRPADWLERGGEVDAKTARTFYGGRCFDLTIRTSAALDSAEAEKRKKYAGAMQRHPHLGLTVVALSLDGATGKGAEATFTRWAFHLTKLRKKTGDLCGRPRQEVRAAFGFAFATVMVMQISGYFERLATGGSRYSGFRMPKSSDRIDVERDSTRERVRGPSGDGSRGVKRFRGVTQSPRPLAGHGASAAAYDGTDPESEELNVCSYAADAPGPSRCGVG